MHYANRFHIAEDHILKLQHYICQNVGAEMAKNVRLEMLLTCLFCVYLERQGEVLTGVRSVTQFTTRVITQSSTNLVASLLIAQPQLSPTQQAWSGADH